MKVKATAKFAIPCAFGQESEMDRDSVFFLMFDTEDEKLAYKLASCVCGSHSKEAMLIISENGELFQL